MTRTTHPRLIDCDIWSAEQSGKSVLHVMSRQRLAEGGLRLPATLGVVLTLLDGKRSVAEIQREVERRAGVRLAVSVLEELLLALDGIYVLDTQRHHARKRELAEEFHRSRERAAVCAGGVYPTEAGALERLLDGLYTMPGGPGLFERKVMPARDDLRAVLAPHMDYRRGRHSFAWSFKEIVERSRATTFVMVGTSHYSLERFVLTAKDFVTPFGVARTHGDFVALVADRYGQEIFKDEISHRLEHSLELEVVLLQHALAHRPDFQIVPLLVGSFGDTVDQGTSPGELREVRRLVQALVEAEEACGEEVCYIISGDLAHLGPKFGDHGRVTGETSDWCRGKDEELLGSLESAQPEALFSKIYGEGDARRVCGFPPLYVALSAARPARGRKLCYEQFVDPDGSEMVSFASMAFER